MKATIICPTYNHGRLVQAAIRSVLRQTHQDFEVFIIGDGVTEDTRQAVMEVLAWDERLRFIDREKSPRHGEPYRHEVLTTVATGEIVCYISDDDLWTPEHLATMAGVLAKADVAHSRSLFVAPDGKGVSFMVDWEGEKWRQWTTQPPWQNAVGLTQVGHRMEAYHRLPHGWRTTPPDRWTDHYMWQQMLELPWVRAASTREITVVQFPHQPRKEMSIPERMAETAVWEERMQDPVRLRRDLELAAADYRAEAEIQLRQLGALAESHYQALLQEHAKHASSEAKVQERNAELEHKREQIGQLRQQRDEYKAKLLLAKEDLAVQKQAQEALPRWLRALNRMFAKGCDRNGSR